MQLISSRTTETTTLSAGEAREALFRDDNAHSFSIAPTESRPLPAKIGCFVLTSGKS
jgi:hypothetical protein